MWKDQLTSYDGNSITYDALGNPTSWINGESLTWTGRRLTGFGDNEYAYNSEGILQSVNGAEYTFDTDGKIVNSPFTEYYYDENGAPVSVSVRGVQCYYVFNAQGDVTKIVRGDNGAVLVEYEYDAWGNLIYSSSSTTYGARLLNHNIYRYRGKYGYVFERNSGLYYLQTRFYDPVVGRFLNADDTDYLDVSGTTLGCNLYAYCENNGVNLVDSEGQIANFIFGAIWGAVSSAVLYYLECLLNMRSWNWWIFLSCVALGAALGALGSWLKDMVKIMKFGKLAIKSPRLIPFIRKVLTWGIKGFKIGVNGFFKSLSRKPGESWGKFIVRVIAIPVS